MPSHSLARMKIEDLDIYGYSVSGEETVVAMPQLDVCFDIGKAPDQVIPINHCLLTHGHIDHAAGIAYYLSHRKFAGQRTGTVLAPEKTIAPIRDILDAWGRLDGNQIPANLIGVKAGDEYQIKPNLITRVFDTKHSRGSVGYTVIETRTKLKQEYTGLSSIELVKLKKQGIRIDNPVEIPIVTYFGDTAFYNYSELDYVKNSKILIIECTFFMDEHMENADAGMHLHVDEFSELIKKLNNEHIIITHLTKRSNIHQIKKILTEKLPSESVSKISILMHQKRKY